MDNLLSLPLMLPSQGDLLFFESLEGLIGMVEPPSIRGAYRIAFDASGRLIKLTTSRGKGTLVAGVVAEIGDLDENRLRTTLRDYAEYRRDAGLQAPDLPSDLSIQEAVSRFATLVRVMP